MIPESLNGHSPRPPSRRVEQLRRQVRRGSGADNTLYLDDDEDNNAVESDDFTFEGFFTGNFDVIPQPRIMMTSTSLSYRSATTHVKDEPWKASHLTTQKSAPTFGTFITNEDEQQRQAALDREEANEFFPLPPSGSKLGDLLLSSDDDTSQSCSNASTPPPQSLGDALQRSFKLFHADEAETSQPPSTVDTQQRASLTTESSSWESPSSKPLLPVSAVDATLAHRRGYPVAIQQLIVPSPNCAQGVGHHRNDPPSPTSVLSAIPLPLSNVILATPASTEPYDHQHSNALDIIELFASCNVDIATTTLAPSAASPQEDHASHLCAADTIAQRGTDEIPSSLNEQAVDGNESVAPLLASSPPITQPRAVTPPTPVTAAMQDVLRNTEVFDWFDLDDDEADEASTTQPHHQQHDQQSYPQLDWVASIPSVQEVGLDALVSYVPSMMALESRTFCGDSPQHSMSMRHTQGTTSPVVSIISTSFHGALAKFQFPPTTEDTPLDEMIIKPIVRQRSQVIVQPQAVVVQRHARHEVATQTTTPRVTQSKESDSTTTTSLTSPMVKINRALSPATLSLRSLPSRYLSSSSSSSSSSPSTSSSEDGHDSPTPIQPSEGSDDSRAAPVKAPSPSPSVDSLASAATTPVPMEQLPSTTAFGAKALLAYD